MWGNRTRFPEFTWLQLFVFGQLRGSLPNHFLSLPRTLTSFRLYWKRLLKGLLWQIWISMTMIYVQVCHTVRHKCEWHICVTLWHRGTKMFKKCKNMLIDKWYRRATMWHFNTSVTPNVFKFIGPPNDGDVPVQSALQHLREAEGGQVRYLQHSFATVSNWNGSGAVIVWTKVWNRFQNIGKLIMPDVSILMLPAVPMRLLKFLVRRTTLWLVPYLIKYRRVVFEPF
jgi:hypothetical protein